MLFLGHNAQGDDIHCIVVAIRYLLFICFLLHRIKISWYKKVWEEQVYIKKKLRFECFVLFFQVFQVHQINNQEFSVFLT